MRILYQLDTEQADGQFHPLRTWLVLATSEGEARSLIPEPFRVERIVACGDRETTESRIIGWMGESAWHPD